MMEGAAPFASFQREGRFADASIFPTLEGTASLDRGLPFLRAAHGPGAPFSSRCVSIVPDQSQDIPFFIQDAEPPEQPFEHEGSDVVSSLGPGEIDPPPPRPTGQGHPPQLEILDIHGTPYQSHTVTDRRTLIGQQGADLVLPDHAFVGKYHAQLLWQHQTLTLEPLHASCGVYLAIADAFALEDGDEIMAGTQRLVFHTTTPPPQWPEAGSALGAPKPSSFPHIIRLLQDRHIGGLYPLQGRFTLGTKGTTMTCPQDPLLSEFHASIVGEGEARFLLKDEGSRYGTFIRVRQPVELFSGDIFLIGHMRLRVYV